MNLYSPKSFAMYTKGETLCVMEKDKQYAVRIIGVDVEKQKFKIHFIGFNRRFDEWMDFDSDRVVQDIISDDDVEEETSGGFSNKSIDEAIVVIEESYNAMEVTNVNQSSNNKRKRSPGDEDETAPKRRASVQHSLPLVADDASVAPVGGRCCWRATR